MILFVKYYTFMDIKPKIKNVFKKSIIVGFSIF